MEASQARPADIAAAVLELVRARVPSAETEATVRLGNEALTRFAGSFIHQNMGAETSHISLRVALDGRVAAATMDGPTDRDTLGRLVDDVLAAARLRPADPDWPGLTAAAPSPDAGHWDDDTAEATPEARAQRVADFVAAADGLETAGYCSTEGLRTCFANSAGQLAEGRSTIAAVDGIARTATSDGSSHAVSVRLADLDGASAGRRAAAKARSAAHHTDLPPGRYEVLLEPYCVADIVAFLLIYGFSGRAVEEGRSFVRLGELQLDPALTLRDDVTEVGHVGIAFDAEGTPRRGISLVSGGVSTALLHDRRTAARAGTTSTGNAMEGAAAWGPLPSAALVAAGDRSDPDLLAGMERGLLITDLHYTRVLDPRTLVVTGLTRNGVWLVEQGRIVGSVANVRFTQSYVEALAPGAVRAVGSSRALVPGGFDGNLLVPMLHLSSWNVTGNARG